VVALLDDVTLRDTVAERELSLKQQEKAAESAKLDLQRSMEQMEEIAPKNTLKYTYYTDVPVVQSNIGLSIFNIQQALDNLTSSNATLSKDALQEALSNLNKAYGASSTTQFIPIERSKAVSDTIVTFRQYEYQLEKNRIAYDRAIVSRDSSKLSLEQAKRQLEKATLTAPFDGVITSVPAKEGVNIGLSTNICRLVDLTQVEMKGLVDEGDVGKLKANLEAIVTLDSIPGIELRGKLAFVSPVATMQSGVVNYQVIVTLVSQNKIMLRDGMTASANMVLEKRSNVLLISRRAISGTARERYVDVIIDEASSRTERRTVTTGFSDDDNIEITSGLKAGEKVLLAQVPGSTRAAGGMGMPIR
jgi:RND family efflux transporter MFP subunit